MNNIEISILCHFVPHSAPAHCIPTVPDQIENAFLHILGIFYGLMHIHVGAM